MPRTSGRAPDCRRNAAGRVWLRLCRFSITRRRLSRRSLERFAQEVSTTERTLVVHSRDIDHARFFPNSVVLSTPRGAQADRFASPYIAPLEGIENESFQVIVCTALLEHVPDPARLISEFHRVLKPGGRLIITASAVFPFHGAPANYFHFTPNGLRYLFRDWTRFDVLRGSSRPFETLAIMLQRINLQCDVFPPVRPLIELAFHALPRLDLLVLRQYDGVGARDARAPTDAFMPAALHAVVVK